jgi:hypothetical protein
MPASRASCGLWKSTGLPSDAHRAVVQARDAAEQLHQRRLAGAVLAHERPDLAGAQSDRSIPQRTHGAVGLGRILQLDERPRGVRRGAHDAATLVSSRLDATFDESLCAIPPVSSPRK